MSWAATPSVITSPKSGTTCARKPRAAWRIRKAPRRAGAPMARSASQPSFFFRYGPEITGLLALVGATLVFELLVRIGIVNRFVIPPPSDVILAFERVVVEENILG